MAKKIESLKDVVQGDDTSVKFRSLKYFVRAFVEHTQHKYEKGITLEVDQQSMVALKLSSLCMFYLIDILNCIDSDPAQVKAILDKAEALLDNSASYIDDMIEDVKPDDMVDALVKMVKERGFNVDDYPLIKRIKDGESITDEDLKEFFKHMQEEEEQAA